ADGGAVLEGPKFQRHSLVRFGNSGSVRFSPDDKLVAFVDRQFAAIRLWEIATNREVAVLNLTWPNFVRFSNDRQTLLAATDRAVRIWNLTAAREKIDLGTHVGGVSGAAFSPDGKLLASACNDRTARIYDAATGRLVQELTGLGAEVASVAFSPD